MEKGGEKMAINKESQPVVDFTELADQHGLEYDRVVEFTVGDMRVRLPRSADDPTPDNVLRVGGMEFNVETGELTVK